MVASKCSWNHFISYKYKTVQSFKLHSLQNSTLLPIYTSASDCKCVKTFLETVLWKLFEFLVALLMTSVVSQKRCSFNTDFIEATGKNHLDPGQESTGEATVCSYCSLLISPWSKPTGVLEHCREGETKCFSSFFGLGKWNMTMCISLLTVVISVKYTSEFWENFEATIYSKSKFTLHFSSFVTHIIHPFMYLHIF